MTCLTPLQKGKVVGASSVSAQHFIDVIIPDGESRSAARMILDLFQAANELLGTAAYSVSVQTMTVASVEPATYGPRRTPVFLGDLQSRWTPNKTQRGWLTRTFRLAPRAVLIGGAVFLSGFASDSMARDLAIHPNFAAAASEEQLAQAKEATPHTQSGRILSAISVFAALPLFLTMIKDDHGQFVAGAVGDYLGLTTHAAAPKSKTILALSRQAKGDPLILSVLNLMQEHIEEPLQIRDLAEQLGISIRKLERRFQDKISTTPLTAYRALRIERAHQLLVHSGLSLSEITVATGFGTRANLNEWIRKTYGVGPSELRAQSFGHSVSSRRVAGTLALS